MEFPYLVNALAEGHGFFHRPEQFHFLGDVIDDSVRHPAFPPTTFLVVDCDAGIDAYSLGIALLEIRKRHPQHEFSILGTDFLADNLPRAIRGVYPQQSIATLPDALAREYFLRSRSAHKALVRLRPGVRAVVRFRSQDMFEQFSLREPVDVIFCRHVLHYFAPPLAISLADHLRAFLHPGGLLFLGREIGKLPGFHLVGPAVYQVR